MDSVEIAHLIAPLHAASWKSTYRGIFSDEYLDHLVDEDRLAHWRKHVRELTENDGEIFIARLQDEAVGFLCIERPDPLNTRMQGAYVNNLHVMPHIKGQGIGTALLEHGTTWARQRGFEEMMLFVYEDNVGARRFYQSNGWHVVERLMAEVPGGTLAAELRLVKKI
jgi:ribosomal protein S18 acetylase RimI-like enzyme